MKEGTVKSMKRIIALAAALGMCLSMSSCGILYSLYRISHEPVTEAELSTEPRYFSCDLWTREEPQVLRAELTGTLHGAVYEHRSNVLHNGVVGRFGAPVEVTDESWNGGRLTFYYNPEEMDGIPPENLIMLHYSEEEGSYDTIESELDTEAGSIGAEIPEPGVYLLADSYAWYGAWGQDVSDLAHDTVYRDDVYRFSITVPQGIALRYVSDYIKEDEEGRCQTLLECEENDRIRIGIEYLERPNYENAQAFANTIAEALKRNGAETDTGIIRNPPATVGFWCSSRFDESAYSVNCFYPMTDNQYINVWYGFTDPDDLETVMASLESFRFTGQPDLPEVEEPSPFIVPTYNRSIGSGDVSIELPDKMTYEPADTDEWETKNEGGSIIRAALPLWWVSPDENRDHFCSADVELVEMAETASQSANAVAADMELIDYDEITVADGFTGYLVSVKDGPYYAFYAFCELPAYREYLQVTYYLDKDADEALRQEYWDSLHTIRIGAQETDAAE